MPRYPDEQTETIGSAIAGEQQLVRGTAERAFIDGGRMDRPLMIGRALESTAGGGAARATGEQGRQRDERKDRRPHRPEPYHRLGAWGLRSSRRRATGRH